MFLDWLLSNLLPLGTGIFCHPKPWFPLWNNWRIFVLYAKLWWNKYLVDFKENTWTTEDVNCETQLQRYAVRVCLWQICRAHFSSKILYSPVWSQADNKNIGFNWILSSNNFYPSVIKGWWDFVVTPPGWWVAQTPKFVNVIIEKRGDVGCSGW